MQHGEKCFCDSCIKDRVRKRVYEEGRARDEDSYIRRRGGWGNPPPSKVKPK